MTKSFDLERRADKVLPGSAGLKKLLNQRKIRLYQGFDPTGKLHIGHGIGLRLLMEFAAAGHEVIFLFGTGTVLVGDPSQRESARQEITKQEIQEYAAGWKQQVAKVVDFNKVQIKQNADWLTKLTLTELIEIASKISAVQLFKRESFQRRLDKGDTVWYHETMYPVLQAYDSVVLDVDLEIGGSDQEFNMLMGRELIKKLKNKEKYVLTLPLILGTDGEKMSASKGNCIWMDDKPAEMHGKLMSVPDSQIMPYLRLITDVSDQKLGEIEKQVKSHPRDAKARMATEVVKIYHSDQAAREAAQNFDAQFKEGKTPEDIPSLKLSKSNWNLADLLLKGELVSSKSEARRVLDQGGVQINSETVKSEQVSIKSGDILQVGKRKFVRIS